MNKNSPIRFPFFLISYPFSRAAFSAPLASLLEPENASRSRGAAAVTLNNILAGSKIDEVRIRTYTGSACASALVTAPIVVTEGNGVDLPSGVNNFNIRGDSLYTILSAETQTNAGSIRFMFIRNGTANNSNQCECLEAACSSSPCTLSPTTTDARTFSNHTVEAVCSSHLATACENIDDETNCTNNPLGCLWFGICIPAGDREIRESHPVTE